MKPGTRFTTHHRLTGPVDYLYLADDPDGWDTVYRHRVQNVKTGEISYVDSMWFKVRQVVLEVSHVR